MKQVIIVYHSDKGRTKIIAEAIARGIGQSASCNALLVDVTQSIDWDALHGAAALVFGSPTYMGSVSAPFKTFMDASSGTWMKQGWKNKIAAGFTTSYAASGDKLNVLAQMAVFAAQHGMVWVGQGEMQKGHAPHSINRLGSFLGLMAQSDSAEGPTPPEGDIETARLFGERIALLTSNFSLT